MRTVDAGAQDTAAALRATGRAGTYLDWKKRYPAAACTSCAWCACIRGAPDWMRAIYCRLTFAVAERYLDWSGFG